MLFMAHVFSPNRVIGYNFPPVNCAEVYLEELTIVSQTLEMMITYHHQAIETLTLNESKRFTSRVVREEKV